MQLPTSQQREFDTSCSQLEPTQHWPPTNMSADHSIGHRYVNTAWILPSKFPSNKEADAGHECRGYRHGQPAPTHPSSLHTHSRLELNLPCTASTCVLLCHQAICSKPQIFKDLSHLLSSGAASRFQNAPRCSGVDVRMAADRVRCHVRLTPHRFFVRQSSDFDCAIEVVPSRFILETFFCESASHT